MLWLNKDGFLIAKDGYLIDCDKCPCGVEGYAISFDLDEGTTRGLYVVPKPGCNEFDCLYDYSEYNCVDSIHEESPECTPDEPPCPFHWHEYRYPYYDPLPPQDIIDAGTTWKIENDTLYVWERQVKIGFARTTVVFSIPEGCEFVGGRVCSSGWIDSLAEVASLSINGNHATLTYLTRALFDGWPVAITHKLVLLCTCRELTIDSLGISGLNDDCWDVYPEGLRAYVRHYSDLNAIMDEWSSDPEPLCQYIIGEEDEFE